VLNAANSAIFRPQTPEPVLWHPGGRFDLVAHGLIAERYGLDTMVRAVSLLACEIPEITLHVYGKGDYLPELEALVSELGVADHVIVHGFVPEEELLDGIGRAHVGVIAAKRDTFRDMTHTQKMYEYVAMHKPVVIAETPAVRTHFDDSCFQFFASDDPADLASALRDLYYSPARALTMIESATTRYRAYDWDAQRHVYSDAVLSVIPQRIRRRLASQEQVAHGNTASMPAIAMETTPAFSSFDWSGVVMPVEEGSIYMRPIAIEQNSTLPAIDWSGIVMPVEESAI
jgi:glycosyltransferase involved in cell wall biosynthesis